MQPISSDNPGCGRGAGLRTPRRRGLDPAHPSHLSKDSDRSRQGERYEAIICAHGQNSLRTLTRQTGRRSCPLSLRQRTFSSWQILGIDGARAPDSEDIATHKDLGRIDERIDALLSQPPPGDIDEDEWRRDAIQTAFAEVKPEFAEWFKEVEESNPEAMEMLNAVAEEDPPPGMDELEWAHRQFARMQQMIQSGALPIEVPRPPPPD